MRTGVRVLAAALAAASVAACSDPKAAPLPPTVSPTTASATPTPAVSTSDDYEAQARRAVAAYFAALNAALRDPARKTDALAALIDPSCTCRQVLDLLRDLARNGHHIDYAYTVSDVRVQQAGSLGASMTYVARQSAGHKRDRTGQALSSFPATTVRISAHFRRDGGRWLLDRLDQMR